jgi:FKBP-type peptidyl-prolyl cis-trans isomerase
MVPLASHLCDGKIAIFGGLNPSGDFLMRKQCKHPARSLASLEALEDRRLLSVATSTALVASTNSSAMGQDVTFTATVTPQGAGTPTGFVRFSDGGTLLGKVTIDSSGVASFDTYTLFKGAHTIVAKYKGDATFAKSSSNSEVLSIKRGPVQIQSDGLGIASLGGGTGPGVVAGDQVQMEYAGYLKSDGSQFDSSFKPQRAPFGFVLDAQDEGQQEQVIQGFDQGATGMQVGETRLLSIPSAIGYGPEGNGPIPPNADLFFIIRLVSFETTTGADTTASGANSKPIANAQAPSFGDGTDFGQVPVDTTSSTASFDLAEGTEAFSLSFSQTPNVTVTGADASDFVITSQPTENEFGGFDFTVQFTPSATGLRKARLNIFTNDADIANYKIKMQGTGV